MSFARNRSPIRLPRVSRGKAHFGPISMYGGSSSRARRHRAVRNLIIIGAFNDAGKKRRKTSNSPSSASQKNYDSADKGVSSISAFIFLVLFVFLILTLAVGWIVILIAFAAPLIVVLGFVGLFLLPFIGLTKKK